MSMSQASSSDMLGPHGVDKGAMCKLKCHIQMVWKCMDLSLVWGSKVVWVTWSSFDM